MTWDDFQKLKEEYELLKSDVRYPTMAAFVGRFINFARKGHVRTQSLASDNGGGPNSILESSSEN